MSRKQMAVTDIEDALDRLSPAELWQILERLMHLLRQLSASQQEPQNLYGIWQDAFPIDFDIDQELDDIRHEWDKEWSGSAG